MTKQRLPILSVLLFLKRCHIPTCFFLFSFPKTVEVSDSHTALARLRAPLGGKERWTSFVMKYDRYLPVANPRQEWQPGKAQGEL